MVANRTMIALFVGTIILTIIVITIKHAHFKQSPPISINKMDSLFTTQAVPVKIETVATSSGWMGDGEGGAKYVHIESLMILESGDSLACYKISYFPGPAGWAGIYWLTKPDNWGKEPGISFAGRGFTRVTFRAKGEIGGERIEFKVGGVRGPNYTDSAEASTGIVVLTKDWSEYQINLRQMDLSNVINSFGWVASGSRNPKGIAFYLHDVMYR